MKSMRTGKSFLGEVEARLRRLLNLQGRIPVDLPDPAPVTPVVVVGNALLPGMSDFRGRYFSATKQAGAGTTCIFRPTQPVIIDRIVMSSPQTGIWSLKMFSAADTTTNDGLVAGRLPINLVDGVVGEVVSGDIAQVTTGLVVGGVEIFRAEVGFTSTSNALFVPFPMFLNGKRSIGLAYTGAANVYLTVMGRIF